MSAFIETIKINVLLTKLVTLQALKKSISWPVLNIKRGTAVIALPGGTE